MEFVLQKGKELRSTLKELPVKRPQKLKFLKYMSTPPLPPPTLVSFTQKDETMQNAKNHKKIVRLTLIDALMCPKTFFILYVALSLN